MYTELNFIVITAKIQFDDLDSLNTYPNMAAEVMRLAWIADKTLKFSLTFFIESVQIMHSVDH